MLRPYVAIGPFSESVRGQLTQAFNKPSTGGPVTLSIMTLLKVISLARKNSLVFILYVNSGFERNVH